MRPITKAIFAGIITVTIYLLVVVITTPALEPLAAIHAAFQLNSIVIIGMGIGMGLQIFLSEKSKQLGCKLDVKKKAFGGKYWKHCCNIFFLIFLLGSTWMLWLVALCAIPFAWHSWNRSICCTYRI